MNNMLDLETANNTPDSAILSIGAVHFDTEHVSQNEFYCTIKPGSAIMHGSMGMSTIQWWMQQQDEARRVWNEPEAVNLDVALMRFSEWVKGWKMGHENLLWGNGSDFDNVILAHAYARIGMKPPWSFRNNRCFRTLKGFFHADVASALYKKYDTGENGVKHNAVYDARLQANIAKDMLILIGR